MPLAVAKAAGTLLMKKSGKACQSLGNWFGLQTQLLRPDLVIYSRFNQVFISPLIESTMETLTSGGR